MMTWRFVRVLRHRHTGLRLFWPVLGGSAKDPHDRWLLVFTLAGVLLIIMLQDIRLVRAAVMIAGLALILTLLNSSLMGIITATRVGHTIASLRARGQYDLLCLLPAGPVLANWMLCAAYLQRHRILDQFNAQHVWVVRAFFVPVTAISTIAHHGPIETITLIVLLFILFHVDDVQSLVIAALLGMIWPTFTARPTDTRVYAFLSYLLIQLATYTIGLLVTFNLLPVLLRGSVLSALAATLLQMLLGILSFYSLREAIIQGLWHVFLSRMEAAPSDIEPLKLRLS